MAELIAEPTVISAEDALRTEIILNQALIDILIAKNIISEDELISGIKKIMRERGRLWPMTGRVPSSSIWADTYSDTLYLRILLTNN